MEILENLPAVQYLNSLVGEKERKENRKCVEYFATQITTLFKERLEKEKTIDPKSGMCWICSFYGKDCECRHNKIIDDLIKEL